MTSTITSTPSMPQLKHTAPVFIVLSICGFYFIALQMVLSKAPDRFLEVQKASAVPLQLIKSFKLPFEDTLLTPLISFFVSAFGNPSTSTAYPLVIDFVWSFGAAIQLPLLEAQRSGVDARGRMQSGLGGFALKALSYPMVWGILYQRLSGGWILPLWLLAFMHASTRAEGRSIDALKAESVLFGWWAGHTIPAIAMLVPNTLPFTSPPIWIAFPILMSVCQSAYYKLRVSFTSGKAVGGYSGYIFTQVLYLSALVGGAIAHLHSVLIPNLASAPALSPFSSSNTLVVLVNKFIGLLHRLYVFYVPVTGLHIPSPATTTADSGVQHFVQFDIMVVFAAVWIALIWDLALRRGDSALSSVANASTASSSTPSSKTTRRSSSLETASWALKIFGGLLVGSLATGFGTATAALLLYREEKMRVARQESSAQNLDVAVRETTPLIKKPTFS